MSADELQSTVNTSEPKQSKIAESIENLGRRILTLVQGNFTGAVYYELNMQGGVFKEDYFGSRGRMTPKRTEENNATRVPDAK